MCCPCLKCKFPKKNIEKQFVINLHGYVLFVLERGYVLTTYYTGESFKSPNACTSYSVHMTGFQRRNFRKIKMEKKLEPLVNNAFPEVHSTAHQM